MRLSRRSLRLYANCEFLDLQILEPLAFRFVTDSGKPEEKKNGKVNVMNRPAIALFLLTTLMFGAAGPNMAGQWKIHSLIAGHETDQDCTFVQTANMLSGSCKSEHHDVQINGSIDGKNVTWKYESEYNGSPLTLVYTATLDDTSRIAGSVEVQPYGVTGEFSATITKPAAGEKGPSMADLQAIELLHHKDVEATLSGDPKALADLFPMMRFCWNLGRPR